MGASVSGAAVTFSIIVMNSGTPASLPETVTVATKTTGSDGNAEVIYSPGTKQSTDTVNDTIQATLTNGSTERIETGSPAQPPRSYRRLLYSNGPGNCFRPSVPSPLSRQCPTTEH